MTKSAMVFIGMGLVSLPFATYAHANEVGQSPGCERGVAAASGSD